MSVDLNHWDFLTYTWADSFGRPRVYVDVSSEYYGESFTEHCDSITSALAAAAARVEEYIAEREDEFEEPDESTRYGVKPSAGPRTGMAGRTVK